MAVQLPGHLHDILEWEFIPWMYVKNRHGDFPNDALVSLFESYRWLGERLDLANLAVHHLPDDSRGCLRCGSCCAYMRPGAVSAATYRRWEEEGALVARFYTPVGRRKRNPTYNCWYNNRVRLRLCPFLMNNLNDLKPFCVIYHMGRNARPRACSRFRPDPPSCQMTHVVIVP
jgi:hypothetical protein